MNETDFENFRELEYQRLKEVVILLKAENYQHMKDKEYWRDRYFELESIVYAERMNNKKELLRW